MAIVDGIEGLHHAWLNINDPRLFQTLSTLSANTKKRLVSVSENSIRFEHVPFGYSFTRKNVIQDMSFTITPDEKTAVVGLNGAGKTTLVKLLCGLYAPGAGKIFLGGRDILNFSKKELFSKFSVVFQDIYLLPTTIE